MFCQKCGAVIHDEAVVCPNCGVPTANAGNNAAAQQGPQNQSFSNVPTLEQGEKPGLANAALAFAFLMPIVGLILGIIGAVKYKTQSLKTRCIIAIPVSVGVAIVCSALMSF